MESRQQKDLELWQIWKKSKNPADLSKLLDRLKPLIHREVSKWGGAVPTAALEVQAKMLVVKALEMYDPNRGAAIGTHVTARLRKLSRSVYPYQDAVRLPENKQVLYNTFNNVQTNLMEQNGREPTAAEMAKDLGWSQKKVRDFRKSYSIRTLVESEGGYVDAHSDDSTLTDFYYNDLSTLDKGLFEDITGYGGKKPLNNPELRRKHNLTQGQLSHRKRKFVDQLKKIQQGVI